MTEGEWSRFDEPASPAFAEKLRELGLTLVYHHHMGTVVQSERRDRPFDGRDRDLP